VLDEWEGWKGVYRGQVFDSIAALISKDDSFSPLYDMFLFDLRYRDRRFRSRLERRDQFSNEGPCLERFSEYIRQDP
jgi:hypothetical protein